MAEEDLLPKKTMVKAWNQGLNLTSAPIQHVIRIMTFAEEALLPEKTMAKAWNQGLNLTNTPIQDVIPIMTFDRHVIFIFANM